MGTQTAIDLAGWLKPLVASLLTAGGMVFWVGGTAEKVDATTNRVVALESRQSSDHDAIVKMQEKVDNIEKTTKETRDDVKKLLERGNNGDRSSRTP